MTHNSGGAFAAILPVVLILVAFVMPGRATAGVRVWTGGYGGDWITSTNWTPNAFPRESDRLYLYEGWASKVGPLITDSGGSVTVNASNAPAVLDIGSSFYVADYDTGMLTIQDGGAVSNSSAIIGNNYQSLGQATVSGAGSTWTSSSELYVSRSGTGTLTIEDGGTVSNTNGFVADLTGGSGQATVRGAGSTWTNSDELYVGREGAGTLTIQDGGAVSNTVGYVADLTGSSGQATVRGAGSTWTNSDMLYVGREGAGTLAIQDGGTVSSAYGYLGYNNVGSGQATVRGAGSTWTNSQWLHVGYEGTGTLTIEDGGAVSNTTYGAVGYMVGSSGQATVRGAGSTWTNGSELYVGHSGTGTLTIEDGATVSNTIGVIAKLFGSSGEATVRGAGSTWINSQSLFVGTGDYGTGTLTIQDGGRVRTDGWLQVAVTIFSEGTVNLEGGTLSADSLGISPGTPTFNWSGGTLEVTGASGASIGISHLLGNNVNVSPGKALDVAATTNVDAGATLAVTGGALITDTLDVSGTARLNSGQITIRDTFNVRAQGTLEISGQDLALASLPTLEGLLSLDAASLSAPALTVDSGEPDNATLNFDSGMISLSGPLTNNNLIRMGTSGPATIRAASLNNNGSLLGEGAIQAPLTNTGNVGLSGDSDFSGDVTNQSGGRIVISGGSNVTFFEDVDNQSGAEIRVSQNSSVTYFGSLTGTGSFTGTGTTYIEGDMRPGASPGTMAFAGDVVFGSGVGLKVEVGGTAAGRYDVVDVAGTASLDGTLEIVPIDGFVPRFGDTFEIFRYGAVEGDFAQYEGLDLGHGMTLEFNFMQGGLVSTVVPEPATLVLLALAGLCVLPCTLRTRRSP